MRSSTEPEAGRGSRPILGPLCHLESLDFLLCVTGRHWRFPSEHELHYKQLSWGVHVKMEWKRVSGQQDSPVQTYKDLSAQTTRFRSVRSLRCDSAAGHTHN